MTFVTRYNGKVVSRTTPCPEDGQNRLGALHVTPDVQVLAVASKQLQ